MIEISDKRTPAPLNCVHNSLGEEDAAKQKALIMFGFANVTNRSFRARYFAPLVHV